MTSFFVIYTGGASTPLDRDYYVRHHVPLVRRAWERHGLTAGSAFFPARQGPGVVTLYRGDFEDEDAMRDAIASPESPEVMADVEKFTAIKPEQAKGVPVEDAASNARPVRMIVTCHGDAITRFDRGYYADRHLPLAMETWGALGLERAQVLFPPDDGGGVLSAGIYDFRDAAALRAALEPAAAKPVMDDVARFTDAEVRRELAVPLESGG